MCKITKSEDDTMLSNCCLDSAYLVNGDIPTMGMAEIITRTIFLAATNLPLCPDVCHQNDRVKRFRIEYLISLKKMKPSEEKKKVDSFTKRYSEFG